MMIYFLKNNYHRISSKKYYVIISLFITVVSIFAAIYLTSKTEVKGNIAVVTKSKANIFESNFINFTTLEQEPSKYELVLGKYDGIIIDKDKGKYDVYTIKGDDFRKQLIEIVKNPKSFVPENKETRGVGSNIIGYLLMFILIQCIQFMFTLSEDIELKQIERIAMSPVSFFKYLFSHFISTFFLIFIPTFLVIAVLKSVFAFNIGFGLLQYVGLLAVMCFLGITFIMFMISIVKSADTVNMMSSSIIILTTILAGSFYSFEKGNEILKKAIWILPQKDFLSFTQGLESGKAILTILPQLVYVIMVASIFLIFSFIKIKKDYVLRED